MISPPALEVDSSVLVDGRGVLVGDDSELLTAAKLVSVLRGAVADAEPLEDRLVTMPPAVVVDVSILEKERVERSLDGGMVSGGEDESGGSSVVDGYREIVYEAEVVCSSLEVDWPILEDVPVGITESEVEKKDSELLGVEVNANVSEVVEISGLSVLEDSGMSIVCVISIVLVK